MPGEPAGSWTRCLLGTTANSWSLRPRLAWSLGRSGVVYEIRGLATCPGWAVSANQRGLLAPRSEATRWLSREPS